MAKLYFYFASMNAGKSALLLQTAFNYRERGMDVSLWTAALDDRGGRGGIDSRIGLKSEAHGFQADTDIAGRVLAIQQEAHALVHALVVLVGEAALRVDGVIRELDERLELVGVRGVVHEAVGHHLVALAHLRHVVVVGVRAVLDDVLLQVARLLRQRLLGVEAVDHEHGVVAEVGHGGADALLLVRQVVAEVRESLHLGVHVVFPVLARDRLVQRLVHLPLGLPPPWGWHPLWGGWLPPLPPLCGVGLSHDDDRLELSLVSIVCGISLLTQ